ncbi:SipW-dependent-type signal peptide-containing protein [Streptomyces sp. AC495_CC817]|uniref:SipW-dependent-type signal peptide-containing protein n=1 Tax=Streptomyces sp. AC495_CC817 TaxID=2823900 RepID=UPI001C264F7B|nr:SipW-dependent-type signal peptide-containing protein [Streptomyces sp. AC495_CC817]
MATQATRRKVMAVLAGGLVLGVGTAVTLAAWNDSEFANSTFTAGSFSFTGSSNGTDFTDHATSGTAASLTFQLNPTNLSPGEDVYAPYALRLTGTYNATLSAVAPVGTGSFATAGKLTYAVVSTGATFGCNATAFNAGTAAPTTMTPGTDVNLCIKVTAASGPSGIQQGDTGTVTWQWNATSVQP